MLAALIKPISDLNEHEGRQASLNFDGVASSFDLMIQVSVFLGLIVASPVWLYQLWAFIVPGLHKKERRLALSFVAAAVPLFVGGVLLAWLVLPNAVRVLTDFTPSGGSNFISAQVYLSFVLRLLLAFGIAFLLPVVLVGLNLAGNRQGQAARQELADHRFPGLPLRRHGRTRRRCDEHVLPCRTHAGALLQPPSGCVCSTTAGGNGVPSNGPPRPKPPQTRRLPAPSWRISSSRRTRLEACPHYPGRNRHLNATAPVPSGPQKPKPTWADFIRSLAFELDDFQREACLSLQAGRGVLVAAPTGAGKTIVGEFAIYLALQRGLKAFYTTPIKALSNQKYAELADKYGADQVGLLTGDTSINGDAPVVVMTTEVLRNMLYADSSTLGDLGYVVMDEVHYLADRFRGAVWEEVIIHLPSEVQVASLSATVSNAEEFGAWLDTVRGQTDVIVSEHRPVPLWQHVMVGRKIVDLFAGDTSFDEIAPAGEAAVPARLKAAGPGAVSTERPGFDVNPELLSMARAESQMNFRGRFGHGGRNQSGASSSQRDEAPQGDPRSPVRKASRPQVIASLDRQDLLAGHHLHLFPGRLRRRRGSVRRGRAVADHRAGTAHHCPARR